MELSIHMGAGVRSVKITGRDKSYETDLAYRKHPDGIRREVHRDDREAERRKVLAIYAAETGQQAPRKKFKQNKRRARKHRAKPQQ